MSLVDEIVNLSITVQDAALTRAGFGTPLVMGHHSFYGPELVRTYSSTAAMIADGFPATDPLVLVAGAIFSQNPKVTAVKIGRRTSAPVAQSVIVTVGTVLNSQLYTVTINGTAFTFTSDATATAAEIAAGLVAAINLGSVPVTAVDNLDGTFDLNADVAGAIFTLEINRSLLTRKDDTANAGVAADYAAIKLEDDDFYGVLLEYGSTAEIAALAAVVEADRKIFGADTANEDVIDDIASNLGETLSAANFNRSYLLWSNSPHDYPAAAWMGNRFPFDPGSSTWAYKALAGVTIDSLTDSERSNLSGNNVNYYTTVKGLPVTIDGSMASGRFIDITRGIDWLFARIQERIIELLTNVAKVPYTDAGVALIEAALRAQLREGIGQSVLAADPEPTVSVPLVSEVSATDRGNRFLPDVTFTAQLAGAIHTVEIAGTVSV